PTARLGDKVGDVARRAEASGHDIAVVITAGGVVLGIVDPEALEDSSSVRVEEVMRPGPATYRPDVPVQELVEKLAPKHLRQALLRDDQDVDRRLRPDVAERERELTGADDVRIDVARGDLAEQAGRH